MTPTQRSLSVASVCIVVLSNLKTLADFFGVPMTALRIAGLVAIGIVFIVALRERRASSHLEGFTTPAVENNAVRVLLWTGASICFAVAACLVSYVSWLSDEWAVARYRKALANETSRLSLFGRSSYRDISKFVIPKIVRHESFRTIVADRDALDILLLADGSVDSPPIWTLGFGQAKTDVVLATTTLSAKARGSEPERAPISIDLECLLEPGQHVLLLGRPGTNERSLSQFMTWKLLARPEVIPVPLSAGAFTSLPSVVAAIHIKLSATGWQLPESVIEQLLERGRFTLVVEDFDTVRLSSTLDTIRLTLLTLASRYPRNGILVFTGFTDVNAPLSGYTLCEVTGYTPDQQDAFAKVFFDRPEIADKFVRQLRAAPRLRQLSTNPLLLSLMCLLYDESHRLSDETSSLYDDMIETLMNDARIPPTNREAVRVALGETAAKMTQQRIDSISDLELRKQIAAGAAENKGARVYPAIINSGLLMRVGRERFAFVHPILQDFLAAEFFSTSGANSVATSMGSHATDYFWQQVLAFYAARHPDFVRQMLDAPDDLFESRHYLVDHILRSGLVKNPSKDMLDQLITFHLRMLKSRYALQRYRSLSAFMDWMLVERSDPLADRQIETHRARVENVVDALNDVDYNVCRKAARGIAKVRVLGGATSLGEDRAEELFHMFLSHTAQADARREMLAHSLGAKNHLEMLQRELGEARKADDPTRSHTYETLMEIGGENTLSMLVDAFFEEDDLEVCHRIAEFLRGNVTIRRAIDTATRDEPTARIFALATASRIELPTSYVARGMAHKNVIVRVATIRYIGETRRFEFVSDIKRLLQRRASPTELREGVQTLTQLNDPMPETWLEQLCGANEPVTRAAGAHGLRAYTGGKARKLLLRLLGDASAAVKTMAVESLGRRRDRAALADLLTLLRRDGEPIPVRIACVKALESIGGLETQAALRQYAIDGPYPVSEIAMLAMNSDRFETRPEEADDIDTEFIDKITGRREDFQIMLLATMTSESRNLPYLLRRLGQDRRFGPRLACAMEATRLSDADAIEVLSPLVYDDRLPVRDAAFVSLYIVARRSGTEIKESEMPPAQTAQRTASDSATLLHTRSAFSRVSTSVAELSLTNLKNH